MTKDGAWESVIAVDADVPREKQTYLRDTKGYRDSAFQKELDKEDEENERDRISKGIDSGTYYSGAYQLEKAEQRNIEKFKSKSTAAVVEQEVCVCVLIGDEYVST